MQSLLVDLGNSRIKWALHDGKGLQAGSALTHRGQDLRALLAQAWNHLTPPQRVVIASVAVSTLQQELANWIQQNWSEQAQFITSPASGQGLTNSYAEPGKLGCDRWAAMVAAYHQAHAPVCVVDCGSAVTIDMVDATGQHLGGLIVPGMHTMQSALTAHTSLPEVDLNAPVTTQLGKNTQEAIAMGIKCSIAALVEQTREQQTQQAGQDVKCYLTGGDAEVIAALIRQPYILESDLVLQGLAIIAHPT